MLKDRLNYINIQNIKSILLRVMIKYRLCCENKVAMTSKPFWNILRSKYNTSTKHCKLELN